jgi:hypothetical protein
LFLFSSTLCALKNKTAKPAVPKTATPAASTTTSQDSSTSTETPEIVIKNVSVCPSTSSWECNRARYNLTGGNVMVYPDEAQTEADFVFNFVASYYLNNSFVKETMVYFNFTNYKL